MKYLSPEQKQRLAQLAREREQHRKRRRAAKAKRLLKKEEMLKVHKTFAMAHSVRAPAQKARYPIMIPETLSLRDNYTETIEAIHEIREMVLKGNTPVFLYFDKLRILEPAANSLTRRGNIPLQAASSMARGPYCQRQLPPKH